jgi:hypothetical protein
MGAITLWILGFTSAYTIGMQRSLYDQVCQLLASSGWFTPRTLISN